VKRELIHHIYTRNVAKMLLTSVLWTEKCLK